MVYNLGFRIFPLGIEEYSLYTPVVLIVGRVYWLDEIDKIVLLILIIIENDFQVDFLPFLSF